MKKNSIFGKLTMLASLGAGIVAFIIACTPLRMMAIYPAIVGLWIGFFALVIASRNIASKKWAIIAVVLSGVALGGAYLLEGTVKDKVVKDEKFEQTIDQTAKETEQGDELDDALDELE